VRDLENAHHWAGYPQRPKKVNKHTWLIKRSLYGPLLRDKRRHLKDYNQKCAFMANINKGE
jgi:hypothetical protein